MNMDLFLSISGVIIIILIGVVGFFLRILHTDLRTTVRDLNKLDAQVSLIKQDADSKIEKLTALTQLEMRQLTKNIEDLTSNVEKTNENIQEISHVMHKMLEKIIVDKN